MKFRFGTVHLAFGACRDHRFRPPVRSGGDLIRIDSANSGPSAPFLRGLRVMKVAGTRSTGRTAAMFLGQSAKTAPLGRLGTHCDQPAIAPDCAFGLLQGRTRALNAPTAPFPAWEGAVVCTGAILGQRHADPLPGQGLGEADRLALGLDQVGVMQRPIGRGRGQLLGHQFVQPRGVQVRGQRHRSALVGGVDESEERLGGLLRDRQQAGAAKSRSGRPSGSAAAPGRSTDRRCGAAPAVPGLPASTRAPGCRARPPADPALPGNGSCRSRTARTRPDSRPAPSTPASSARAGSAAGSRRSPRPRS